MTKTKMAERIGVTRQFFGDVLAGRRNFSVTLAKRAARFIGGSALVWIDGARIAERAALWAEFRRRNPTGSYTRRKQLCG